MSDWTNLCADILGQICNIIGPYNCANVVCKTWRNCTKIYYDIKVSRHHNIEKIFEHVSTSYVKTLDMTEYFGEIDFEIMPKFKSLKKLYFNEDYNGKDTDIILNSEELEELKLSNDTKITIKDLINLKNLRKLSATRSDSVTNGGLEGLRNLEELVVLELGGLWGGMNDDGLKELCGLKKIQRLSMWASVCTDEGLKNLREMILLEELDVHACDTITDEGMKIISEMKSIKKLNISECGSVTDEGLKFIGEMVWLINLNIKGMMLHGGGLNLREGIKWLNRLKLQVLNVGGTNIDDDSMRIISTMESLDTLLLSGCENVHDDGIKSVSKLHRLRKLDISDLDISDEAVYALSDLTNLEELNISECKKLVGTCMSSLNVKALNITGTNICDDALQFVCANMEELNMEWCEKITDRGLQLLSECAKGLCRLTITECNITNNGLLSLQHLPRLRKLAFRNLETTDHTIEEENIIREGLHALKEAMLPRILEINDFKEFCRYGEDFF